MVITGGFYVIASAYPSHQNTFPIIFLSLTSFCDLLFELDPGEVSRVILIDQNAFPIIFLSLASFCDLIFELDPGEVTREPIR